MLQLPSWLSFIIVACLWGCTNPFLKKGQESIDKSKISVEAAGVGGDATGAAAAIACANDTRSSCSISSWRIWKMMDYRVLVPFVINQSGSVLFYFLLSQEPLGTAVPTVNCLTFVFTAVTSIAVNGERVDSYELLVAGILMVIGGMFLCSGSTEE